MFEFRSFRHVCLAVLKCYICVCISELRYKGDLVTILLIAVERLHESPLLPFVVYMFILFESIMMREDKIRIGLSCTTD